MTALSTSVDPLALYFGCQSANRPGHYLFDRPCGLTIYDTSGIAGFPWSMGHLDTGLLDNGTHRDTEDGSVFWTCGGRPDLWFAFFWWDRSGDARSNSNSGFYVRGFDPETLTPETARSAAVEAFRFACERWPAVVKRQRHPLVLQGVSEAIGEARKAGTY